MSLDFDVASLTIEGGIDRRIMRKDQIDTKVLFVRDDEVVSTGCDASKYDGNASTTACEVKFSVKRCILERFPIRQF